MSTYRVIVRRAPGGWYWLCGHCGMIRTALTSQQDAQREALKHLNSWHSLTSTLRTYYAGVTAAALAARAREDDDDPWGEHDDVNGLHRLDAPKSCVCAREAMRHHTEKETN